MRSSTLKRRVDDALVELAWNAWAQMGVLAEPRREERRAMDPEALLLFTLEIGRSDARLFDEVLDWLIVNGRLLSVQRLRNLCRDDEDEALAEAALAWAAQHGARLGSSPRPPAGLRPPEPLFRAATRKLARPDAVFLGAGFVKPETRPSGKSRAPDLHAPINFAFRLRQLFGVGSRAEVLRELLTSDAPFVSANVVAESAGYAKRNVHETLGALAAAGALGTMRRRGEIAYSIDKTRWASLLGLSPRELPQHQNWQQLFWALRTLARWLAQDQLDGLSPYMLASEARTLAEQIDPALSYAGVPVHPLRPGTGEEYWQTFVEIVDEILGHVTSGLP